MLRFFAAFLNQFYVKYNNVAESFKIKLFKDLNAIKVDGKVNVNQQLVKWLNTN